MTDPLLIVSNLSIDFGRHRRPALTARPYGHCRRDGHRHTDRSSDRSLARQQAGKGRRAGQSAVHHPVSYTLLTLPTNREV